MTASPAELRLMLLDGAIKFLQQGKAGLEAKDYEASYNGISRCQNILMELINALRPEHAQELCTRLSGLYTFMYTRLIAATTERDPSIAQEVLELLQYERETWRMVMDQQASEQPAPTTPDTAHTPEAGVGGKVSVQG